MLHGAASCDLEEFSPAAPVTMSLVFRHWSMTGRKKRVNSCKMLSLGQHPVRWNDGLTVAMPGGSVSLTSSCWVHSWPCRQSPRTLKHLGFCLAVLSKSLS